MAVRTAGPWRAEIVRTLWRVRCDTGTRNGRCIASDLSEAEARLIAAAPSLIEALRNFTDGRDIAYTDALVAALDAIAAATPRSPR